MTFKPQIDLVKNVDLSRLPILIVQGPGPRWRFGQVLGVVLSGLMGATLLGPARQPLVGYVLLGVAVWSLIVGEFQIRVLAPKRRAE